jgi:hypothetical protein
MSFMIYVKLGNLRFKILSISVNKSQILAKAKFSSTWKIEVPKVESVIGSEAK